MRLLVVSSDDDPIVPVPGIRRVTTCRGNGAGSGRRPRTLMDAMRPTHPPRPLAALLVAGTLVAVPLLSGLGPTAAAAANDPIGGARLATHRTVGSYSPWIPKLPPL